MQIPFAHIWLDMRGFFLKSTQTCDRILLIVFHSILFVTKMNVEIKIRTKIKIKSKLRIQ